MTDEDPIKSSHWLQRLYLHLHNRKFSARKRNQMRSSARVVSLGNLSAGGTGKTPLGVWILDQAVRRKLRPAVLLRGYGGQKSSSGGLAFDGSQFLMDSAASGDEAQLYHVEGARVIVGANRWDALQRFGRDQNFILLDDAFQNPSVYRDVDLVLIDSTVALNRASLLPLGKFRESLEALQRADGVVLTRTDLAPDNAREWKDVIQTRFPGLPVWKSVHSPGPVTPLLEPGPVVAVSGIGNPGGFEATLKDAGYDVQEHFAYRDHYSYRESDFSRWQKGWPVVTTEKDLVRIRHIATVDRLDVQSPGKPHLRGLHYLPVRLDMDFHELGQLVFGE
ncbi:MAG TPA: tetraacyldisaccharide 4'-kinase [Leptospiraceae bacterium]|nr:tetraacyldisaccharide 4'-kinase [Spirochaetaceae bacterium]HBS03979.1 tetraacyldisaccharide 4'-kinase [Leptospiraceae bacterium]